jgi:hypothetical protein
MSGLDQPPLRPVHERGKGTQPTKLNRLSRIVAAVLAGIWIGAGLAGIGAAVLLRPHIMLILLSLAATGYGLLWARVSFTGRQLTFRRRPTMKEQ